jgi:hypothetical protein
MFVPQFDDQVYAGFLPNVQHFNPTFYATKVSAYALAALLVGAGVPVVVTMGSPIRQAPQSPLWFSTQVPWIKMPSGFLENAGSLMMWWVQDPTEPDVALARCKAALLQDEADWKADAGEQAAQGSL